MVKIFYNFVKLGIAASMLSSVSAVNFKKDTALHLAAKASDLNKAQRLLNTGMHLDALNADLETPLHLAVKMGNFEMVLILCKAGAVLNARNADLETPLHLAAKRGNLPIVRLLLQRGAILHFLNADSETALHLAARMGHIEIVFFFLKNGPSVNKFLPWYIWHTCTGALKLSLENHNILIEFLRNSHHFSPAFQEQNPLLRSLFIEMLTFESKIELIENIFTQLEMADEQNQKKLIQQMDYFFSQEDTLEEFCLNFEHFKANLSLNLLEKLKKLFRYHHAKKLKIKFFTILPLFNVLFEDELNEVLNIMTTDDKAEYVYILDKIQTNLMHYCNHTKIQSNFVKKVIEFSQRSRAEKIIALVEESNASNHSSSAVFNAASRQHIDNILHLIRNVKVHLDYIIENKGMSFDSPAFFNSFMSYDILLDVT